MWTIGWELGNLVVASWKLWQLALGELSFYMWWVGCCFVMSWTLEVARWQIWQIGCRPNFWCSTILWRWYRIYCCAKVLKIANVAVNTTIFDLSVWCTDATLVIPQCCVLFRNVVIHKKKPRVGHKLCCLYVLRITCSFHCLSWQWMGLNRYKRSQRLMWISDSGLLIPCMY